jgi:hypothetical protein
LFWFGAESIYHPQLVDDYYIFFISIFMFIYTFSFYYIFIDIWKYSKIELIANEINDNKSQNNLETVKNYDKVISFLKMKSFKMISIINFLVFITLNLLNLIFTFLIISEVLPGIKYNLPGTGTEGSEPIAISHFTYFLTIIPPTMATLFLIQIYRDINNIDYDQLNKFLATLPKPVQENILGNISLLNKEIRNKLRME